MRTRRRHLLALPACLFLFPAILDASDPLSAPAGGTSLFPQDPTARLSASRQTGFGNSRWVPAQAVPFSQALEIRTLRRPADPWDFQLGEKIPVAIHRGDVLWFTAWMRATETSDPAHLAYAEIVLQQRSFPFEGLSLYGLTAGEGWRQFAWTCVARHEYAPGQAELCLRAGFTPQVIQVGGLQVLDYGNSVRPSALPQSRLSYPGMEPDAPWRKAAADRIEKYRKADLRVLVQDAAGRPITGARVRIRQTRQAFGFGSCVDARLIEGNDPRLRQGPSTDGDRYRGIIRDDYSKVVLESDLKWGYRGDALWGSWSADAREGHQTTLAALHWLRDRDIDIRGHNLLWPSWFYSPADLYPLRNDPRALERRIDDHIRDIVGATRGLLTEWDVVNEPYANHDLLDRLPPGAMAGWFKLVHQLDPKPELFLNDYAGFMQWGLDTRHKDAFEQTLRALQARGAPIGGLGIQAHFGQELPGPGQVLAELDRWARLGLDIQITEFDVDIDDEQLQAQFTRDFMTAVFSHPAVSAFLMWGFWERADGKPRAALYRRDWSIKPNGQAWNDLVLNQWHTDLTIPSDASGAVSTRGFMGQYQVTVTARGVTKTWPLTLSKKGAVLRAVLPAD